jgi:immune inhibitor A
VSYSIEDDWDYAYLKVSTDGGTTWTYVETNLSTTTDPNQQNEGFGITGCSGERTTTPRVRQRVDRPDGPT